MWLSLCQAMSMVRTSRGWCLPLISGKWSKISIKKKNKTVWRKTAPNTANTVMPVFVLETSVYSSKCPNLQHILACLHAELPGIFKIITYSILEKNNRPSIWCMTKIKKTKAKHKLSRTTCPKNQSVFSFYLECNSVLEFRFPELWKWGYLSFWLQF